MVQSWIVFFALMATSACAAPLEKRIAQVISESTQQWEKACDAAGGGQACNPASVKAFSTLLAAAGPCDQQNAADDMMDLSKQLNSDQMIALTQIFAQQPRNSPTSQAVPYCQQAPRNPELNKLFQCQFQGANQKTFVGGIALGAPGTIPFGQSKPLTNLGSCLANPSGPIADGTQLVDLTQNPGVGSGAATSTPAPAPAPSSAGNNNAGASDNTDTTPAPSSQSGNNNTASSPTSSSSSGSNNNFQLQNGQDAQKLNKKFQGLTADSSCSEGDQACIDGGFAMCVNGKFVNMGCSGGTQCAALPLVNKPGTSLACTTPDDALARIAASGATGGLTGQ